MSIIIAYFQDQRIHIQDYQDTIHKGNITCPLGHAVVAKRGNVKKHHYAHKNSEEGLQSCSKGLGSWHRAMQDRIKPEYLEIRFFYHQKLHIADVYTPAGIVVEYQSSIVPPTLIHEREEYYARYAKDIVWVFNCQKCDIEVEKQEGDIICFRWIKGSMFMFASKKKRFLDFGKRGFIEILASKKKKCIGRLWTFQQFDETYLHDVLKPDADTRYERHEYQIPHRCSYEEIGKIMKSYLK